MAEVNPFTCPTIRFDTHVSCCWYPLGIDYASNIVRGAVASEDDITRHPINELALPTLDEETEEALQRQDEHSSPAAAAAAAALAVSTAATVPRSPSPHVHLAQDTNTDAKQELIATNSLRRMGEAMNRNPMERLRNVRNDLAKRRRTNPLDYGKGAKGILGARILVAQETLDKDVEEAKMLEQYEEELRRSKRSSTTSTNARSSDGASARASLRQSASSTSPYVMSRLRIARAKADSSGGSDDDDDDDDDDADEEDDGSQSDGQQDGENGVGATQEDSDDDDSELDPMDDDVTRFAGSKRGSTVVPASKRGSTVVPGVKRASTLMAAGTLAVSPLSSLTRRRPTVSPVPVAAVSETSHAPDNEHESEIEDRLRAQLHSATASARANQA